MDTKVSFSVWDWRDILRASLPILESKCIRNNPDAQYISFSFQDGIATVYCTNNIILFRADINVQTEKDFSLKSLLLPPIKAPAHTKAVELYIDPEALDTTVSFVDEDNDIVGSSVVKHIDICPPDFDRIYKSCQGKIDKYNYGAGLYHIAVNPAQLIAALQGVKDDEKVILNFAEIHNAFMIRPVDRDGYKTLILPVRWSE